jgi:5-guanidino-2-oxopentanoate decarboxylase
MAKNTLGAAFAHALKARGVDTVFGIPGVHNVELYRGLEDAGITHVLARHEQGAGFMADGYARATGRPGVAFVITGPGLTNVMTPMGQAHTDSVPVLVISSCLPEKGNIPGRLHQMRDQTGAAACVCDWSEMATDSGCAFELLDRAFGEFASPGRSRPKHISIPIDLLAAPAGEIPAPTLPKSAATLDPAVIADVSRRLERAKRPLFIFGGGAANASDIARSLVACTGAAVFSTYAGRGIIAPSYALNFGATLARPGSAGWIEQADLVIAVGSELGEVDLWRENLGHRCPLVRIDTDEQVLADRHTSDVCIQGDAATVLQALHADLKQSPPKWDASDIAQARAGFRAETDSERPGIVEIVDVLAATLPDDVMFYSDMTQFAYVAKEVYPMQRPGLWHHPYGFGTLGYALPAAIGGKIARPDQPVIAIAGDYGFQYTMQELGVAAEMSLPLPIILWDNDKLKEIEQSMILSQIAPNAVTAKNPDFEHLAAAYGLGYAAPRTLADIADAMRSALQANGPTLVHIRPLAGQTA